MHNKLTYHPPLPGETPLFAACKLGSLPVVQKLLSFRANTEITNTNGKVVEAAQNIIY